MLDVLWRWDATASFLKPKQQYPVMTATVFPCFQLCYLYTKNVDITMHGQLLQTTQLHA